MFLLLKVHQVLTGTQISFELKVPVVCDTSPHHFLSCKMTFFFSFSVIFFKEKKKKILHAICIVVSQIMG